MIDPFLKHLGLAKRAGCLAVGQDRLFTALDRDLVRLIVASDDIGNAAKRQLSVRAARMDIAIIAGYDRDTLGQAVGLDCCTVLGILDEGFAESLKEKRQRMDA